MKTLVAFLVLWVLACASTHSQTNYVLCQSLLDGTTTAVFPNACPSGWVFIRYV